MEIIQYDQRYREDFIRLNVNWIQKYFKATEPSDHELFSHIGDWLD